VIPLLRSTVCDLPLMRRQPSCFEGAIRQEEEDDKGPSKGEQAEDNE